MGKAKVKLELIAKEKPRNRVFKKRKESLIKKMHELTVLCDVPACIIIQQKDNVKLETWPANYDKVHRMINIYKANEKEECFGVNDFFPKRTKKMKAKYPTQHEGINAMNERQLREFATLLNNKVKNVKSRIGILKKSSNKQGAIHPIDQKSMMKCRDQDEIMGTTHPSFVPDMNSNFMDLLNQDSDFLIDLRDFEPDPNDLDLLLEMNSSSTDFTNQDSDGDFEPCFSISKSMDFSNQDSSVFIHGRDFTPGFSFLCEMNSNSTDISNQDSDVFIHEKDFELEPGFSFLPKMDSNSTDFSNQDSAFIDEGFRTWLL